jgi:hypothetical protein
VDAGHCQEGGEDEAGTQGVAVGGLHAEDAGLKVGVGHIVVTYSVHDRVIPFAKSVRLVGFCIFPQCPLDTI